jgi:ATP-dependent RNA helicase DeaD
MKTEMLSEETRGALHRIHIDELSEVQAAIPDIMAGKDMLVQAPTGSGKTLAFLIPAVERLLPQGKGRHDPQVLILEPTRELAQQTADTARQLLSTREGYRTAVLAGGCDIQKQIRSFHKGADIVVATPARLCDHLRRHTFKTPACTLLVVDEADLMLSMGFVEDVLAAADALPEHQTLLFSATMDSNVRELSPKLQKDPVSFTVSHSELLAQKTDVHVLLVPEAEKPDALLKLVHHEQTMIFCNHVNTAEFVSTFLKKKGFPAGCLHSRLKTEERKETADAFRSGRLQILCATDAACRGIDIPAVRLIICYDFPDEEVSLIHRVGRTSRAGTSGEAWILTERKEDIEHAEKLLYQKVSVQKFRQRRNRSHQHA